MSTKNYDVIVIGAGAAGLMAAYQAGRRGKSVLVIEHAAKIGEKIRISGGGRCNFTNLRACPTNYVSNNPHFVKSALASFTQFDFIELIKSHAIDFHEKTLGQLFCDGPSQQIIDMLLSLCRTHAVELKSSTTVFDVTHIDGFLLSTNSGNVHGTSLIIATGGLSIPLIGATDFGYKIARQFGIHVTGTRPGLVPLIVHDSERALFTELSGVATPVIVTYEKVQFRESVLFTHKGLSGPAILQISSYLKQFQNESIYLNLLPDINLGEVLINNRTSKQNPLNFIKSYLPQRLVDNILKDPCYHHPITDMKNEVLSQIGQRFNKMKVTLSGSEGYKKAEVTVGGIDTQELSSKTMESKKVKGLFFIGEVVDVTGWLGGYNFQWAWSSGTAAGRHC